MDLTKQDFLSALTPAQREAATHLDGPLLVLAGPGSGKTRVITHRIAYLIAQGIPPWQVLALTFTNKAAGEMRERVMAMLRPLGSGSPGSGPPGSGNDATGTDDGIPGLRGLTVSTFHAFSARMLRRYAPFANLSPRFSIYDTTDQRDALKRAMQEAGLDSKNWTPASVSSAIGGAKNKLIDAEAYAANASDFYTRAIAKAYRGYEKILRASDALDFDDLLLRFAKLLRDSEPVRRELQHRFQYILIDEYQDTNHAQFMIAHTLAQAHRNMCVVGDPDQSIYAWRGADLNNILEFEQHYPKAKIIPLGQNFRSTGHIVNAAAGLIGHNRRRKHKRLHTELPEGEKPTVVICTDEHHEAQLVVDAFRRHREAGVAWKEMAVLYRVNALSRVMEEALRGAQIPYTIARGTAFYDRKEIKDALAYLRVIVNPNDSVSLRRIINTPTRGIGKTTLDRIELFAIDRGIGLHEALARAGETPGEIPELAGRAASAVAKFVAMTDSWRPRPRNGESGAPDGEFSTFSAPAVAGGPAGGLESHRDDLAGLVERVIRESGLEQMYAKSKAEEDRERVENLSELVSAAADFLMPDAEEDSISSSGGPGVLEQLAAWLESVALMADADTIDPESGAVTLMTLHAAKGLEFSAVAMIGLEEGLLPHIRAATNEMDCEEERRLCFVGMTRARRHLLMTRATIRTHRGLRERTIASQFLSELPPEAVIVSDQSDRGLPDDDEWGRSSYDAREFVQGSRSRETSAYASAADEAADFPIGSFVRHPRFGLGRVQSITRQRQGTRATVAFTTGGTKTLILEYAKLERVEQG